MNCEDGQVYSVCIQQGFNKRKVISEVYAFFFYCIVLSLGGKVNTRRMSKPYMGSIFHINNQWNILVIGNYYVNYQNFQNSMPLPPRILNEHWGIYSCLQIPPRENWFQYVRRVYATAINFPCISSLNYTLLYSTGDQCMTFF